MVSVWADAARTGRGLVCGLLVLGALLPGCGSEEPEGLTDEAVRAEMEGIFDGLQEEMNLLTDQAPKYYPAERLQDFLGVKSLRYRQMGARMLGDGTWKTGEGPTSVYLGVTLVRMETPEGAEKALAGDTADAQGFADAGTLDGSVSARGSERILAFAHGLYYVSVADMGEVATAPALLREAAETVAALLEDVSPRQP
jgi:hypothetical protein